MKRFATIRLFPVALGVTAMVAGLAIPAMSQNEGQKSAGFKFLTIGSGARAVSMGETMVADADDPFVLEYNPSGLAGIGRSAVSFAHTKYFQDTRGEHIAASVPFGPWAVGARVGYFGTDDLPYRTGPSEQPIAFFDATDGVFQAAVARRINPQFSLGLSAAYVIEHIDVETAQSAVFSLGGQYRRSDRLTFGASLTNFGPGASFIDRDFKMPNRFQLGGVYRFQHFSVRGELVAPDNTNAKWHFGTEATPTPYFALRAGVRLGYDSQVVSAGVGARTANGQFGVDYAFAPYSNDFGSTHRFGVSVRP
jgi:hypothetical protein